MVEQKVEQKVEMKKTLSTLNIVALAIAFIGPAAYGIGFLQIVGTTTEIGPAIALAPLLGSTACIFTAISVAILAIKFAYSGGIYSYTRVATNPSTAFMAGWTILLSYMFLPATGALFVGVYMPILTDIIGITFIPFEGLLWALVFGAIMTIFAYIGIKTSARTMSAILLVQYALIFAIAIGAIIKAFAMPGTDYSAPLNPGLAPGGITGISAAGFTFFFAYYGFEATTSFAGETKNPYKSCAWGAIYAILIVGIIYVFWGWALSLPYTSNWPAFVARLAAAGDMSPVAFDVFGIAGIAMLGIAIVISALGSGTASSCSVSRIIWQMGVDGLLPKKLEKLHKKYASPYIAALTTGAVTAIVPIVFTLAGYSMTQAFTFMALWCAWGTIVMYMFVNLDNIIIHKRESTKSGKNFMLKLLIPLIGFAIMAYLFFGSSVATVMLGPMLLPVMVLGIAWEVLGIIYLVYLYKRKPEAVKIGIRGV
jgi:amino acid transporter